MSEHASQYRPDIDGLRAVAILLVVLYHFDLLGSGGFVGVDVFFVISGYLITGIIHKNVLKGEFSFLGFYERRARRILPALFLMLLASAIFAYFVLLPSDLVRFGQSAMASLGFVSNFYFWSVGSYFGPASEMAPLLHTWSLSVEEQFYLALPPMYLLLRRYFGQKYLAPAILAVIAISLSLSAYFVFYRADMVFYWTPFRAWEIALGAWLAVSGIKVIRADWARACIVLLGLSMILAAGIWFDSETPFPGFAALLPCVGAACVIYGGTGSRHAFSFLLTNRLMVFIGLISYSLYLWHWPIIVFAKHHADGEALNIYPRIILFMAAFVAAYISWRFVETPFRTGMSFWRRWMRDCAVTAAGIVLVVSVFVISSGLPQRFSKMVVRLDAERSRETKRDECMNPEGKIRMNALCRIGTAEPPTILVWGDSYSHVMLTALDRALYESGRSGYIVSKTGCPPLHGVIVSLRGRVNWQCNQFNNAIFSELKRNKSIDTLVLAAAWNMYMSPASGYIMSSKEGSSASHIRELSSRFKYELETTTGVRKVVFIEQVPSYEWNVPYKMATSVLRGDAIPIVSAIEYNKQAETPRFAFHPLASGSSDYVLKPQKWFCDKMNCKYSDQEGLPYYFDHGHLNRRGVNFIAGPLANEMRLAFQN